MKKLTAVLCMLLIVCVAASACAEIPTSNVYKPVVSENLKTLVSGKTFMAQIARWTTIGEDEDARMTIDIIVCEPVHYDAAAIILIVLLFLEAFRISVRKLLANHPADLSQFDQWLDRIPSLGS